MALGQFHKLGYIPTSLTGKPLGEITVSGPLSLNLRRHQLPAVIHVMVVQSPPNQHGVAQAKFAKGVLEITAQATRWDLTIPVTPGDFTKGPARGVAVAVIPMKRLFAYETLTWCEHITLRDRVKV